MSNHPVTQMAREIAEQPDAVRRTLDALLPAARARCARSPTAGAACCSRPAAPATTPRSTGATCSRRTPAWSAASPPRASPPTTGRGSTSRDALVVCVSQSGATEEIVDTQAWARVLRRRDRGRHQRRGLAAGRGRRPRAGDPGRARARGAGHQDLPRPSSSRWPCSAPRWPRTRPRSTTTLARVPDEVERLLTARAGVGDAVAALQDAAYAVVSGRGLMMGTALETALKLEETCLRPVRGYSYADLRHGPISVVTVGHDRRAGRRARRPARRRRWSSWPATSPGAARRVVGIGGDAGVRGGLRACTCPVPTCPRPSPRWARSCRRS